MEPEEMKDIKGLFENVLGSSVIIKDNIKATESTVFEILIKKVENSLNDEESLFLISGITLDKIVDPLWDVIETQFKLIYGEEAADIIMWWLMERKDEEDNLLPIEDEEGNEVFINTPSELWNFIKKTIFDKNLDA